MKARFIGKSSCGFEHNREYEITTEVGFVVNKKSMNINLFQYKKRGYYIIVYTKDRRLFCPYTNVEAFLRNWIVDRNSL